jgi:two-component system KDP operon response regulator KdpE
MDRRSPRLRVLEPIVLPLGRILLTERRNAGRPARFPVDRPSHVALPVDPCPESPASVPKRSCLCSWISGKDDPEAGIDLLSGPGQEAASAGTTARVQAMSKERILVVTDDPQLRRLLRRLLRAVGCIIEGTESGEEAIRLAAEFKPDLIVLGVALPGTRGVETIRRLRERSQVPIISLSEQDHESLTVEALDAGADDCLSRPFSTAVLLARMRAVLRRARDSATRPGPASPITFGHLTLDLANRRVLRDGQPVHLTPTEYALLRALAIHAGRVLTHRELLTQVWGAASVNDRQYLHVFVSQLRRKLECDVQAPRHILTEPGVGYRFSAIP